MVESSSYILASALKSVITSFRLPTFDSTRLRFLANLWLQDSGQDYPYVLASGNMMQR